MSLFTEARLRTSARTVTAPLAKSATTVLTEAARAQVAAFDIFLSHSLRDAELVLGAQQELERFGFSVYVALNRPGC